MNFVTIVTAMSGHGGHAAARTIAENNSDYRWYNHPKNEATSLEIFPELKIAPNHFRKRFSNREHFPHMFDRIDSFLIDKKAYYNLIEPEIYKISQGKKLVYVCHETPDKIRDRYPKLKIIQILPTEKCLINVIDRHMKTHMIYPLQENLHRLSGRKNLLNDEYWNQQHWITNNKNKNTLLDYLADKHDTSIENIIQREQQFQKDLYQEHLKNSKYADKSIIIDDVKQLTRKDLIND